MGGGAEDGGEEGKSREKQTHSSMMLGGGLV